MSFTFYSQKNAISITQVFLLILKSVLKAITNLEKIGRLSADQWLPS